MADDRDFPYEWSNPTTPPDELDAEAKELVDLFYEKMNFQSTELRRHEIAKQCAIIHIEGLKAENLSLLEMATIHMDERASLVLNHRLSHLNHLRQKLQSL